MSAHGINGRETKPHSDLRIQDIEETGSIDHDNALSSPKVIFMFSSPKECGWGWGGVCDRLLHDFNPFLNQDSQPASRQPAIGEVSSDPASTPPAPFKPPHPSHGVVGGAR